MTTVHHPNDEVLAAFAAGHLDEGQQLVVGMHVARCATCRKAVASFEAIGGEVIADSAPLAVTPDALSRALHALDDEPQQTPVASNAEARSEADILSAYGLGPWRWIGPGIHYRKVGVAPKNGTRVFMLKAAPGTSLPHHTHTGFEWTCILQGAFSHEHGRYGPGDFDEADDSIEHVPSVEPGEECICIVAMQGQLQLKGLIGKLLQPFVRL